MLKKECRGRGGLTRLSGASKNFGLTFSLESRKNSGGGTSTPSLLSAMEDEDEEGIFNELPLSTSSARRESISCFSSGGEDFDGEEVLDEEEEEIGFFFSSFFFCCAFAALLSFCLRLNLCASAKSVRAKTPKTRTDATIESTRIVL